MLGFAAAMPEAAAIALSRHPWVRLVEENQAIFLGATQLNAPAGIDRIDQRQLPLDSTYTFPVGASGVNVYVVDTGILATHPDFEGRVVLAHSQINDGHGAGNPQACNAHGTHVAGLVGGATHGVAKRARIHSVRVFDCGGFGTADKFVSAMDWIKANHRKPAVINASLHYGASAIVDKAVQDNIDAGVAVVVAAANDSRDACGDSPARVGPALTVGASSPLSDTVAAFSNFGTCLDLYAPGVELNSTWNGSQFYGCAVGATTCRLSGTSMAAPLVAGTAAMYIAWRPTATPAQVAQAVVGSGTADSLVGVPAGTRNVQLFSPFMPGCATGLEMCSGVCTDLSKSFANCGTCGVTCSGTGIKCFDGEGGWTYAGMQCSAGKCVSRSCSE